VRTDRTIANNKQNIIIRDNEKTGTCTVIDGAYWGDRNVFRKEAGKILKYKDLTIEIQSMWNANSKVIPVTTGAIGTIWKSFRKYLSYIPGRHEVKELQNSHIGHYTHAHCGKCWRISTKHSTCAIYRNYRTAATVYMPFIYMGGFRIITVNTLYKGDKYSYNNITINSLLVTGLRSRHEHKQKPQITLSGNKEWTLMVH